MARTHPICRQATTFCLGFERDSKCIGFAILTSLKTCQQVCSRQAALDTSPSHPCTKLHDLVTLHGSSTMFASPQHVATCQVDLPVLNFSSWKVTCPQFPSFNRLFVPDVSTRPGSPFFKNWPDVTTRPPFFVTSNDVTTRLPCAVLRVLFQQGEIQK